MNFTQHLNSTFKMTKAERESYVKMEPIVNGKIKFDKLIKQAEEAKEMYLLLKSRLLNTDESKLDALKYCLAYEKESAIKLWNEAQDLKKVIEKLKAEL